MKKRRILIAAISGILAVMPITAYAAEGWVQDERGWKYQLEDGSWRTDGWVGDDDGTCYYLDSEGYMLTNGYTPDGTWIGADGVWIDERTRAEYEARKAAFASVASPDLSGKDVSQYPLLGKFSYYIEKDTYAYPFMNNIEYAQINDFNPGGINEIYVGHILCYLAGLPTPSLSDYQLKVAEKVKEFLNSFDWQNVNDYEKAYEAAMFIAERSNYSTNKQDITSIDNNTAYSCLINGNSLCDGFSITYHLLTRAVGLRSYQIRSMNHAWNYVEIDGQLYEMDLSWICGLDHNLSSRKQLINQSLSTTEGGNPASEYIWTLNGAELQFNPNLPSEPLF